MYVLLIITDIKEKVIYSNIIGPFDTQDAAEQYAENKGISHRYYEIKRLHSPD